MVWQEIGRVSRLRSKWRRTSNDHLRRFFDVPVVRTSRLELAFDGARETCLPVSSGPSSGLGEAHCVGKPAFQSRTMLTSKSFATVLSEAASAKVATVESSRWPASQHAIG